MSISRESCIQNAVVFVLLLLAQSGVRAQVSILPITGEAYAQEYNALGDGVTAESRPLSASAAFNAELAEVKLGPFPNTNVAGMPAYARAYVDNGGVFWGEVEADNPSAPNGRGNGSATATVEFTMLRDAPQVEFVAKISGGKLDLFDGGGPNLPSIASVSMVADIYNIDKSSFLGSQRGFATLSGRGGVPGVETFDYISSGLAVTPGHYSETGAGFVSRATLTIPASDFKLESLVNDRLPGNPMYSLTGLLDSEGIGLGAGFVVELTITALAESQTGERTATAYLRDPTFYGSPDLTSGGVGVTFSGLSVTTPIPEPRSIVLLGVGLLALAVRRARRGPAHRAYQ